MFSRRNEEDEYTNVDFWAEKFFFWGGGGLKPKDEIIKDGKVQKLPIRKCRE